MCFATKREMQLKCFVMLTMDLFLLLFFDSSIDQNHVLLDKKVKEIRIIPKANARFFEIQYIYEAENIQRNLNKNNALALDLGINNDIGTLVVGYNETFQRNSNIGKRNNQNFVNIPYGQLRDKLEYPA